MDAVVTPGTTSNGGLERILTAPNIISLARVILFAWFCLLLFGTTHRVAAAIVLAIAGSTDFLDGWVARRFNQVSALGQVLDPTVDRIVLAGGIIAAAIYTAVPWWLTGLVLPRESFVAVSGIILGILGARRIDVLFVGKMATFGLMTAFPLLLLGHGVGTAAHIARVAGWIVVLPALACSVYATFAYVPQARVALDEGRAAHVERGS